MKELNRKNHMLKNKKVASKYKITLLATALMISFFFSSLNSFPTGIYSEIHYFWGLPLFPCLVEKNNTKIRKIK